MKQESIKKLKTIIESMVTKKLTEASPGSFESGDGTLSEDIQDLFDNYCEFVSNKPMTMSDVQFERLIVGVQRDLDVLLRKIERMELLILRSQMSK